MFPVQSSLARTTAKTREKDEADMASTPRQDPDPDRIGEVMSTVRLPLENVEFALEQYLLANGQRLDPETRALLAGVRDCVGRVVVSTRRLAGADRAGADRRDLGRAA